MDTNTAPARPILEAVLDPFTSKLYTLNMYALAIGCVPKDQAPPILTTRELIRLRDILISADLGD